MFAGLLTNLQLVLEQRVFGFVPAIQQVDGLAHISASLIITPHQCLDQ